MDIFGWGCVLGYAATGEHPFGSGGGVNTRAWRVLHAEPDTSGVPEPLRALVAAALSRSASDRPSAEELLLTLVGAIPPPQRSGQVSAKARARRAPSALAVAVPLALALLAGAASAAGLQHEAPATGPVRQPGPVRPSAVWQTEQGRPATEAPPSIETHQSSRQATRQMPDDTGQGNTGQGAPNTTTTSVAPAPTLPGKSKVPKTDDPTDSPTPDPAFS